MKDNILWFTRFALVILGSTLAAKGYIETGDVEQFAGAGVVLIGGVWSFLARRKLKK